MYKRQELTLEDGSYHYWQGEADDESHAEGLAIAWVTEKTGEQVDTAEVTEWELISEYEAEERYIQMLDDCHDEVDVCGYKYAPSDALKSLDPIAYRCGFNDYVSSLEEDNIKVEGF